MAADKAPIRHIAILATMGFVAIGSYGLARPAIESLFLGRYGSGYLPWAWLCVAAAVFGVVAIYNRFANTTHPGKLFAACAGLSASGLALLLWLRSCGFAWSDFGLYIWKDVYIVVLVEIFWTYSNLVIRVKTARWLYGIFLICGSLGSISAELSIGYIARHYGTTAGLKLVVVILLVLALGCRWASSALPLAQQPEQKKEAAIRRSFALLAKNRYILLLVGLVAASQLVITLVDYRFNEVIMVLVPDQDLRTQRVGQVYAAISTASVVLQLACGLVLRFIGVGRTLVALPIVVGGAVLGGLMLPGFLLLAMAKVSSKAFDYSLFRAAKEILYIPLSHDEKTRGKALIDIFGYRTAKASASLLLLTPLAMERGTLEAAIVAFLLLWTGLAWRVSKHHNARMCSSEDVLGTATPDQQDDVNEVR